MREIKFRVWEKWADRIKENLKLYGHREDCPVCGINPKHLSDEMNRIYKLGFTEALDKVDKAIVSLKSIQLEHGKSWSLDDARMLIVSLKSSVEEGK